MADAIAVMNLGRIEQMGTRDGALRAPRTEFVANFLGISNLLDGRVARRDGATATFETTDGATLHVPADRVAAAGDGAAARGRAPREAAPGRGRDRRAGRQRPARPRHRRQLPRRHDAVRRPTPAGRT